MYFGNRPLAIYEIQKCYFNDTFWSHNRTRNSITHQTFWHYCIRWPEAVQWWWCKTPLPQLWYQLYFDQVLCSMKCIHARSIFYEQCLKMKFVSARHFSMTSTISKCNLSFWNLDFVLDRSKKLHQINVLTYFEINRGVPHYMKTSLVGTTLVIFV